MGAANEKGFSCCEVERITGNVCEPGSRVETPCCAESNDTSDSHKQGSQREHGVQGEKGGQTYDDWADRIRLSSRMADLQDMLSQTFTDRTSNGNTGNSGNPKSARAASSPSTAPRSLLRGSSNYTPSPHSHRGVSFDSSADTSPTSAAAAAAPRTWRGGQPAAVGSTWSADDDAALWLGAAAVARHGGLHPPTHAVMLSLGKLRKEGSRPGPYDER
jgi:hypothetical protein